MSGASSSQPGAAKPGVVYLVGGGPGDPGLLTLRGAELLASADAILYDRLSPAASLRLARPDALVEFAGKGPHGDSQLQANIEDRMLELAREGKSVVRLKGGDPLLFGRGAEEAAALRAAGIEYEIVAGVTAGVAASAYAGIPVTHRDHASAVAFVTGHASAEQRGDGMDWDALARFPGTLVFYMGVRNLPRIAEQLMAAGRSASEPVAVVANGTTARQHTVTGTVADIAGAAEAAGIAPPALTVVGPVVADRELLDWFERRPLRGYKVVVTRARAQAGRLGRLLAEQGAEVIETPAIRVERRDDDAVRGAAERLSTYDLVCCTSENGVEALFATLAGAGLDARALVGVQVGAVGRATADAFAAHGIAADYVPERATAEGLLDEIETAPDRNWAGARVLLAIAAGARPVLREGLVARQAEVDEVAFYDTIVERLTDDQIAEIRTADSVTFASGSAVRSTVDALGGPDTLRELALVSIGPTTSAALREFGLEPAREATEHNVDGLVDAVLASAVPAELPISD